jgi:glycosyltransferase involved in cell wall biosynthesis
MTVRNHLRGVKSRPVEKAVRLLIVTQYYPPETGAPQARLSELARRLRDRGHRVTVLTAVPNYPTGAVFPGYRRKLRVSEEREGIRVVRTWIIPSKSQRFLPRFVSYASFALASLVVGIWKLGRQDVVFFESPPLTLVPSALLIGRRLGARCIMNVSDIWPDIMLRLGYRPGKLPLAVLHWLERLGYRSSAAVAVTNAGAEEQIRRRFPDVVTTVISNGVDLERFSPDFASHELRASMGANSESLLVGYFGLHGLAQGLECVIQAAHRLRDDDRIKFVLAGDGPTKADIVGLSRSLGLENVKHMERMPLGDVPPFLASCDVGLVPLASRLPGTMPSKVYEALASGVPVIVTKGCEAETLVSRFGAGKTYSPGNSEELARAIRELAAQRDKLCEIGKTCRKAARRFDRDVLADRLEGVVTAVARGDQPPGSEWRPGQQRE